MMVLLMMMLAAIAGYGLGHRKHQRRKALRVDLESGRIASAFRKKNHD